MQLLAAPSVCPSVRRHRITGHRLLFRLLPDRIQVLDLIPLCTKNTSWALIERPYSCEPQPVGGSMTARGAVPKTAPAIRPARSRTKPSNSSAGASFN